MNFPLFWFSNWFQIASIGHYRSVWYSYVTNDHRYVLFVVNTFWFFPHSWLITIFVTRFTRRVPPTFIPVLSGVRVTRSSVLCVCFVDRYFSFCPFLAIGRFFSLKCVNNTVRVIVFSFDYFPLAVISTRMISSEIYSLWLWVVNVVII